MAAGIASDASTAERGRWDNRTRLDEMSRYEMVEITPTGMIAQLLSPAPIP
jgi:hypothetical protein